MEKKDYQKAIDNIVDDEILSNLPTDKLRILLGEMSDLSENYERELAIVQISSNHSNSKHLCQTILRGKHDDDIRRMIDSILVSLKEELEKRRSGGA